MRDLKSGNGPDLDLSRPDREKTTTKGSTTNTVGASSLPTVGDTHSAEDRFWSKVEKTRTCWEWTSRIDRGGYGRFYFEGGTVLAHRFSYQMLVGPIPAMMQLDHACHVRHCVNPEHLEPVSHAENQFRRKGANHGSKSRWRGVAWNGLYGKWVAKVRRNGRQHHLGCFTDELGAARAAAEKYLELGEPRPLADLSAYLQANIRGDQLGLFGDAS